MKETRLHNKLTISKLEIKSPPLDAEGGRIVSPSGEIAQIVSGRSFQYLAYIDFIADSNAPRGNHYHKEKEESLYVIKGKLIAIYEDVQSKDREKIILDTGDFVLVKSGCAHVYFPVEYTQLVEFSALPFDAADTYKYIVSESFDP